MSECCICFEVKQMRTLSCKHTLCNDCFIQLSRVSSKCHLCRRDFTSKIYIIYRNAIWNSALSLLHPDERLILNKENISFNEPGYFEIRHDDIEIEHVKNNLIQEKVMKIREIMNALHIINSKIFDVKHSNERDDVHHIIMEYYELLSYDLIIRKRKMLFDRCDMLYQVECNREYEEKQKRIVEERLELIKHVQAIEEYDRTLKSRIMKIQSEFKRKKRETRNAKYYSIMENEERQLMSAEDKETEEDKMVRELVARIRESKLMSKEDIDITPYIIEIEKRNEIKRLNAEAAERKKSIVRVQKKDKIYQKKIHISVDDEVVEKKVNTKQLQKEALLLERKKERKTKI